MGLESGSEAHSRCACCPCRRYCCHCRLLTILVIVLAVLPSCSLSRRPICCPGHRACAGRDIVVVVHVLVTETLASTRPAVGSSPLGPVMDTEIARRGWWWWKDSPRLVVKTRWWDEEELRNFVPLKPTYTWLIACLRIDHVLRAGLITKHVCLW